MNPGVDLMDGWRLRASRGPLIVIQPGQSVPMVHQVDCRYTKVTPSVPALDTRVFDFIPILFAVEVMLRKIGDRRLNFCGNCTIERDHDG